MKTLIFFMFISFSILGLSTDKAQSHKKQASIPDTVESDLKQIKKQIEKLEKEIKNEATKKKQDAKESLEQATDNARGLVKKGLNDVADGLSTLEKKVRKMAEKE